LDGRHVIDYGPFSDPADPATALTVECGRHEDEASGDVAFSAAMLFLKRLDMLAPADCAADPPQEPIERYRTTTPYLVKSNRFRLLAPESGFVSVAAGEAVALDG